MLTIKCFYKFGLNLHRQLQASNMSLIDSFQQKSLPSEEIINFDRYYTNIVRNIRVRNNGHKKVVQKTFSPNILTIMQNKIGTNALAINRFLYFRGDKVKELEVLYCLNFMKPEQLQFINSLIENKRLIFNEVNAITGLLGFHRKQQFLSNDSLKLMVQYLSLAVDAEEPFFNDDSQKVEQICHSLTIAALIEYDQIHAQTYLTRVRKAIMRNIKYLSLESLIEYSETIIKYQEKLFTEAENVLRIDEMLTNNFTQLNQTQKLFILSLFAKVLNNNYSKFAEMLATELPNIQLSMKELAIICKSYTLLKIDIKSQLAARFQAEMQLIQVENYLPEIALIIQCLQGHLQNVGLLIQLMENISIDDSYAIKIMLLTESTIQGENCSKLFEQIIKYEIEHFEFKYLQSYSQQKVIQITHIFLLNMRQEHFIALRMLMQYCVHRFEEITNFKQAHDILFIIGIAYQLEVQNYKNMHKHLEVLLDRTQRKIDKFIIKNQFTVKEGLKMIGLINLYNISIKPAIFKFLVRTTLERFEEMPLNEIIENLLKCGISQQEIYDAILINPNLQQLDTRELQILKHTYLTNARKTNDYLEMLIMQKYLSEDCLIKPPQIDSQPVTYLLFED